MAAPANFETKNARRREVRIKNENGNFYCAWSCQTFIGKTAARHSAKNVVVTA